MRIRESLAFTGVPVLNIQEVEFDRTGLLETVGLTAGEFSPLSQEMHGLSASGRSHPDPSRSGEFWTLTRNLEPVDLRPEVVL